MLPSDFMQKFDRQGVAISAEQWTKLQGSDEYRFVLETRVGDDSAVITIWDGYDPLRIRAGEPHLIFETTVFRPSGSPTGGIRLVGDPRRWTADDEYEQVRHDSEEAARAHHDVMVQRIRKG